MCFHYVIWLHIHKCTRILTHTQLLGIANLNELITNSLWSTAQVPGLWTGHCVRQSLGIVSRSLLQYVGVSWGLSAVGWSGRDVPPPLAEPDARRQSMGIKLQMSRLHIHQEMGVWCAPCYPVEVAHSWVSMSQHVPQDLPSVWDIYLCSWQSHLSALMLEQVWVPIQDRNHQELLLDAS